MTHGTRRLACLGLLALAAAGLLVVVATWHVGRDGSRGASTGRAKRPVEGAVLRGRAAAPGTTAGAERVEGFSAPVATSRPEDTYVVSGRVFAGPDRDGVPEARVQVALTLGGLTASLGTSTSAKDGTYALALTRLAEISPLSLRAGVLRVWATSPGYAVKGGEQAIHVNRCRGPGWRVDLELQPAVGVAGRVVDAEGNPVAFATVRGEREGVRPSLTVTTDEDGRYVMPIPTTAAHRKSPGDLTIQVRVGGRGTGSLGPLNMELVEGRTLRAPELVLQGADALSGVAVFPDGTPAAGVEIEASIDRGIQSTSDEPGLEGGEAWTNAEGHFAIRGLRPGAYWVKPRIPEGYRHRIRCITPDEDVHLSVGHHRVRVLVRDGTGGPLPGADVCVYRRRPDGYASHSAGPVPNAEASVSWWEPPGTWLAVAARLPGCLAAETTCTIREPMWSQDVVLTLEEPPRPWSPLHVRVTTSAGDPIDRFWARVVTPLAHFGLKGISELPTEDGSIGHVPPGRWLVQVRPLGSTLEEQGYWMPESRIVQVGPDPVTEVHFQPAVGGRVRVHVRTGAHAEEDDAPQLRLTRADGKPGEDGLFPDWDEPEVSDVLAPGTWILRSETEGFSGADRRIEVVAAEVVDVVLELTRD